VFVGHDWGAMLVGQMALLHPPRVDGVAVLSVPLLPRGAMAPVPMMRQLFGDSFFYILYFQDPGVADADLGADPAETMRRLLAGLTLPADGSVDIAGLANPEGMGFVDRLPTAEGLPEWLSQAELDHYIAEFTRTGFTGGINWYRNFDRNWATTPELDGAHVTVPSTFITGTLDPVNLMSPAGIMDGHALDHRGNTFVDGAGHWVQQQAPDEVNAALLSFLGSLELGGS
jgi:pimeloyl-ACP methyl ester carboxylesterase